MFGSAIDEDPDIVAERNNLLRKGFLDGLNTVQRENGAAKMDDEDQFKGEVGGESEVHQMVNSVFESVTACKSNFWKLDSSKE